MVWGIPDLNISRMILDMPAPPQLAVIELPRVVKFSIKYASDDADDLGRLW